MRRFLIESAIGLGLLAFLLLAGCNGRIDDTASSGRVMEWGMGAPNPCEPGCLPSTPKAP